MDDLKFLNLLNSLIYGMTLGTALVILDEAKKFVPVDYTTLDKYALADIVRDEDRFVAARQYLRNNQKIQAIKEIRNALNVGLVMAKDVADYLLPEFTTPQIPAWERELMEDPPF